jgi:hypothetical protein
VGEVGLGDLLKRFIVLHRPLHQDQVLSLAGACVGDAVSQTQDHGDWRSVMRKPSEEGIDQLRFNARIPFCATMSTFAATAMALQHNSYSRGLGVSHGRGWECKIAAVKRSWPHAVAMVA